MIFGGNDKPIKHDQAARKRFNSNLKKKSIDHAIEPRRCQS